MYYVLSHGTPYVDPNIDYQAILCKKNAPRWLRQIKNYKEWEVTIRNTETGECFSTVNTVQSHTYAHVRQRHHRSVVDRPSNPT